MEIRRLESCAGGVIFILYSYSLGRNGLQDRRTARLRVGLGSPMILNCTDTSITESPVR